MDPFLGAALIGLIATVITSVVTSVTTLFGQRRLRSENTTQHASVELKLGELKGWTDQHDERHDLIESLIVEGIHDRTTSPILGHRDGT